MFFKPQFKFFSKKNLFRYLNFFWGLKAQERELLDENIKIFFNDLTDTDSVIDILQEELKKN